MILSHFRRFQATKTGKSGWWLMSLFPIYPMRGVLLNRSARISRLKTQKWTKSSSRNPGGISYSRGEDPDKSRNQNKFNLSKKERPNFQKDFLLWILWRDDAYLKKSTKTRVFQKLTVFKRNFCQNRIQVIRSVKNVLRCIRGFFTGTAQFARETSATFESIRL